MKRNTKYRKNNKSNSKKSQTRSKTCNKARRYNTRRNRKIRGG